MTRARLNSNQAAPNLENITWEILHHFDHNEAFLVLVFLDLMRTVAFPGQYDNKL